MVGSFALGVWIWGFRVLILGGFDGLGLSGFGVDGAYLVGFGSGCTPAF